MSTIERIHETAVVGRRVRVLAGAIEPLLPRGSRILDVGCGDGQIDEALQALRPDLSVKGVDVLVRADARIAVGRFDGKRLPEEDDAFEVVMFIDVLHHSDHAELLLREARRVARRFVIIKDHTLHGWLAGPTLRLMDRVGNARHGVALPFHYWPESRWREIFRDLGLEIDLWRDRLGLYAQPASLLFDRRLHFLARLQSGGR